MQNLGIVQQDSTVRIMFVTRDGSGGAVAPSSAFENADIEIYKDGGATQRSSDAGVTMTSPFDTVTGLHLLAIDLSDNTDAGFWAAGSTYHVTIQPDETVDLQTVVEVLATFTIETDWDAALRRFRQYCWPTDTIATTTSNSTTALNMTDFLDAQTPDDANVGVAYGIRDATDGRIEYFYVTALTSLVATIARVDDGGALSFTPAAGDYVWPIGIINSDMRFVNGTVQTAGDLAGLVPTNFTALAISTGGAVTAGTVSDKTGYSLSQSFPTNFASLSISTGGLVSTTGGGSGPSAAQIADAVWDEATAGHVSAGSFGAEVQAHALSSELPTNFGNLAITTGGAVTAGTVSDKTGYSLSQSFPTNFGALSISTAGAIGTVTTLTTKTGFALSSTGFNAVVLSEPGAVPTWGSVTAKDGIAWVLAHFRNKVIQTSTVYRLRNDADSANIATAAVTATTSQVTRAEFA